MGSILFLRKKGNNSLNQICYILTDLPSSISPRKFQSHHLFLNSQNVYLLLDSLNSKNKFTVIFMLPYQRLYDLCRAWDIYPNSKWHDNGPLGEKVVLCINNDNCCMDLPLLATFWKVQEMHVLHVIYITCNEKIVSEI